jgi:LPXTG-site transpeptidase (sortase) family protein
LLLAVFVIVLVLAGVTQALSALGGRSAGGPDRAGPDQLLPPSAAQRQQLTVAQAGRPAGYLTIPAIGITHVAIYDRGLDEQRQMLIAPGRAVTRYASSSPLNGTSNTVLYGHDDIQGSVFARLADLRAGDTITVVTSGTSRVYVVQGGPSIVSPTDLAILTPTATPRLTLFSCYPINVDSQRVVVVAAPAPVTSPR